MPWSSRRVRTASRSADLCGDALMAAEPHRRAGVLGQPIAHSLSPVIHNAGYATAGLTGWRYDAHECAEAALAGFVGGLDARWAGLSLTMPLKEVALDVADEVAPT